MLSFSCITFVSFSIVPIKEHNADNQESQGNGEWKKNEEIVHVNVSLLLAFTSELPLEGILYKISEESGQSLQRQVGILPESTVGEIHEC